MFLVVASILADVVDCPCSNRKWMPLIGGRYVEVGGLHVTHESRYSLPDHPPLWATTLIGSFVLGFWRWGNRWETRKGFEKDLILAPLTALKRLEFVQSYRRI